MLCSQKQSPLLVVHWSIAPTKEIMLWALFVQKQTKLLMLKLQHAQSNIRMETIQGFHKEEEAEEVVRKATRNFNWFENFFLTAICKYLCVRRELRHEE